MQGSAVSLVTAVDHGCIFSHRGSRFSSMFIVLFLLLSTHFTTPIDAGGLLTQNCNWLNYKSVNFFGQDTKSNFPPATFGVSGDRKLVSRPPSTPFASSYDVITLMKDHIVMLADSNIDGRSVISLQIDGINEVYKPTNESLARLGGGLSFTPSEYQQKPVSWKTCLYCVAKLTNSNPHLVHSLQWKYLSIDLLGNDFDYFTHPNITSFHTDGSSIVWSYESISKTTNVLTSTVAMSVIDTSIKREIFDMTAENDFLVDDFNTDAKVAGNYVIFRSYSASESSSLIKIYNIATESMLTMRNHRASFSPQIVTL
jgi:hypothetical protein